MRSEANRVSSFMNTSVIGQFKNARVLSEGEDEGCENKGENRGESWGGVNASMVHLTTSTLRAGKDDGPNITGQGGDWVHGM